MAELLVSEVLQKVSNAKTKEQKIKLLKQNNSEALRKILIINYDPSIESNLPEGNVPYKPNEVPEGTEHTRLSTEHRILHYFVKGGGDSLPALKRESMFVGLLEGLHESEAEVVCLAKDKKLKTKYRITENVVKDAFPSVQWGNRK
nr:gp225 [uncultured Mediterranean phage uvMED]